MHYSFSLKLYFIDYRSLYSRMWQRMHLCIRALLIRLLWAYAIALVRSSAVTSPDARACGRPGIEKSLQMLPHVVGEPDVGAVLIMQARGRRCRNSANQMNDRIDSRYELCNTCICRLVPDRHDCTEQFPKAASWIGGNIGGYNLRYADVTVALAEIRDRNLYSFAYREAERVMPVCR